MSNDEFTPDGIYFDTNPLLAAGWPTPSAQLLELVDQAERLGFSLCLPTVVQMELEEHWLRELQAKWRSLDTATETLNRMAAGLVSIQKPGKLPSHETLRVGVRQKLAPFMTNFRSVPLTKKSVGEFVTAAIARDATFKDHGHGFQDAAILYSILDHMEEVGHKSAVLVSEDAAFKKDAVAALAKAAGKTLRVIPNLDELGDLFRKHFTALVLAHLNEEKQRLITAVSTHSIELEKFLNQHLAIDHDKLRVFGVVKRILSVRVVSIEDAHRSYSWWLGGDQKGEDEKEGGKKNISFDVKVVLHLEIEHYNVAPTRKLKVGDAEPEILPASTLSNLILAAGRSDDHKEVTLTVEAEITDTTEGYRDINFRYATVKEEQGLFGALIRPE